MEILSICAQRRAVKKAVLHKKTRRTRGASENALKGHGRSMGATERVEISVGKNAALSYPNGKMGTKTRYRWNVLRNTIFPPLENIQFCTILLRVGVVFQNMKDGFKTNTYSFPRGGGQSHTVL